MRLGQGIQRVPRLVDPEPLAPLRADRGIESQVDDPAFLEAGEIEREGASIGGDADVRDRESAQIVVWLRGNCTYYWRARTAVSLVDFRAQRKKLNDEWQNVRDDIAGQYDKDTFYVGPVASGMNEFDLKIVRGTVDASGSKIAGSGFSVSSHSSSKWRKITYDTAFGGAVTVVATQQYPDDNDEDSSGDTRDNAVVISSKQTHCYIKCGGSNGDGSWRRFHFIAMGQG